MHQASYPYPVRNLGTRLHRAAAVYMSQSGKANCGTGANPGSAVNAGCRCLTVLLSAGLFWLAGRRRHAEPLTLIFAGDIMLDDGPGRTIAAGGDPFRPFAAILADADYRIGNLRMSHRHRRHAPSRPRSVLPRPADTLKMLRGRFDAVSLANNHSGDWPGCLLETLDYLQRWHRSLRWRPPNLAEAHRPLWIEQKGLKIAGAGYNEYKPRRFEAGPHTPGIAWSEDEQVIADIPRRRAAGADHVIPFMHWG